ncbi:MAG: hypothetical protein P8181_10915 [bacterium]
MSRAMWDIFTGSAPYKDVLIRTLEPGFLLRLMVSFVRSVVPGRKRTRSEVSADER